MVGVLIKMFVRKEEEKYINHMSKNHVMTGTLNLTGNKGSVAIRFDLKDTSFMFMNCHLAAHDNNHMTRMENLRKNICENFNEFSKDVDTHTQGHNYKCIFGDFNSRMNYPLTRDQILGHIEKKEYMTLRHHD